MDKKKEESPAETVSPSGDMEKVEKKEVEMAVVEEQEADTEEPQAEDHDDNDKKKESRN